MSVEPLDRLQSRAHVIAEANIDTDIIFPARFLLVIEREGMGQYAFHDWRKNSDGSDKTDFPLPSLMHSDRQILVAGANFGCGSSREHAVWALADLGIRCVIAPGFGEIFFSNCFKSGVLPVAISVEEDFACVRDAALADEVLTVDLRATRISVGGHRVVQFDVPTFRREALLNGWDEIETLLAQDGDAIRAHERRRRAAAPWLFRALEADTHID